MATIPGTDLVPFWSPLVAALGGAAMTEAFARVRLRRERRARLVSDLRALEAENQRLRTQLELEQIRKDRRP